MLVLYLLMAGDVPVDSADTLGHTSLMWAAYQGDGLSVDILLKYGARIDTKDREGFTPLHWAVVKGNRDCLAKILKAGGDVRTGDKSGKTPVDMIKELKGTMIWEKALSDAKLSNDGQARRSLFDKVNLQNPGHPSERHAIFATHLTLPCYYYLENDTYHYLFYTLLHPVLPSGVDGLVPMVHRHSTGYCTVLCRTCWIVQVLA